MRDELLLGSAAGNADRTAEQYARLRQVMVRERLILCPGVSRIVPPLLPVASSGD